MQSIMDAANNREKTSPCRWQWRLGDSNRVLYLSSFLVSANVICRISETVGGRPGPLTFELRPNVSKWTTTINHQPNVFKIIFKIIINISVYVSINSYAINLYMFIVRDEKNTLHKFIKIEFPKTIIFLSVIVHYFYVLSFIS